jgi:serine protease AprX
MTQGEERLPIKVVLPRKGDIKKNNPGGSLKFFEEFTPELRNSIALQFENLRDAYKESFDQYPEVPCVGKVIVKDKAIAKTHKPALLLNINNCPIIGTEKLNEILIKITPKRIDKLIVEIKQTNSKGKKANMTKIDHVEKYSLSDKTSEQLNNYKEPLKIKLFDYKDINDNKKTIHAFKEKIRQLGLEKDISELNYTEKLKIYKLKCKSFNEIKEISEFPGIKKISFFPKYYADMPNIEKIEKELPDLPLPEDGENYPIIGLIDSGIKKNHRYLEPWIIGREEFIAPEYQNNKHGTFVAGIIQYGSFLNNFSNIKQQFKILDIVALPNEDENYGKTDVLAEYQLIEILSKVIPKYCEKVKIWNLSLGTNKICSDTISDLATMLDNIQDEYGVTFILSAGNFESNPVRKWPPQKDFGGIDRITIPADSVRGVTVGSIAHCSTNCVKKNFPSPFTRIGPGANLITKPEVVEYGGNINEKGEYNNTGIISFDENGNLCELIGTSFSAPRVTAIYSNIFNGIKKDNNNNFIKALLINSARNPLNNSKSINVNEYVGFGLPDANLLNTITCTKSSVNLIFTSEIEQGTHIAIRDFPYPKSLYKDGKWYGEIKIVLVYTPPLDQSFGQEYCRTNIDASLGTYKSISEDNRIEGYKGAVPLERKWHEKYERELVDNGFKWNPIKTYYRRIKNGINGIAWRLYLDCTSRFGEDYETQEFVLIVTITDPSGGDIYSDVVQSLRERGFIYNDLQVENRIQNIIDTM